MTNQISLWRHRPLRLLLVCWGTERVLHEWLLVTALAKQSGPSRFDSHILPIFRVKCFEWQLTASDALDLSQEDVAAREKYGLNGEVTASYGKRCLMARRLVERGVRFVQIFIEGQIRDAHRNLEKSLTHSCGKTDKASAALIKDLKGRGLLENTLVIWGGVN